MRKGHGPGGIIGTTERPQTMATWVFSMDATMTMAGDPKKMSGSEEAVQMTHKEESPSRINRDGDGQVAQLNVNVDRALDIGAKQMIQFERSWPEGFYTSLSKDVVTL